MVCVSLLSLERGAGCGGGWEKYLSRIRFCHKDFYEKFYKLEGKQPTLLHSWGESTLGRTKCGKTRCLRVSIVSNTSQSPIYTLH